MFYPKIHLLLDQGRYEEAESAIREELKDSIDDEFLFYLLSITLLNLDKPKEAEAAARQAIAIDADFDPGFFALSRSLLDRGKKREAMKAIDRSIELDPEDADYRCQKAQIHISRNKYKQSLEAAEAGLSVDPNHEDCRILRSICLERLGRSDEAEGESLGLLSDDPDSADSHIARGWVLAERGDAKTAQSHFVEALRIEPDSEAAKDGLIYTYQLRNPLIGWLAKSLVWMSKFPIWIPIIGLFLLLQFGDKIADSSMPPPIPQIGIFLRIFLYSFCVLALVVEPLFDLVLWSSKSTRHALRSERIRAVKWFLLPLILALIYLALFIFKGSGKMFPIHAVIWAALAAVICETFQSTNSKVKSRMILVTLFCLGIVLWVEGYTYLYLLPKLYAFVDGIKEAKAAGENVEELAKQFGEFAVGSFPRVLYPAIGVWLLGGFSDAIRTMFERKYLE